MTDGTITFDTAIDNKGLLKDIEKQKKIIENSTKKIQSLELKKGSLSAEAERLGEELERSGNELAAIQGQINGKKEIGLKATREETAEYNAALRENNRLVEALNKQDAKLRDIDTHITAEQGNISAATQRAAELNDKIKRQPEAWDKAKNVARNFMKRLGNMIKNLFVFSVILAGLRKVKEYFSSVLKNNTQFQASLAQMKGAWQTAFQPVVEWIMPILLKLMNFLTKIGYAIAAIFARFTGKTVSGLKASAKAANDTSKAVKGLNKQMKQLAGFDEMNVLSDSSSSGGAEASAAPSATYDFDTSGIEANLDKIIEIASGALLAIGLILTLFGNWVVGIPLMAAGAALLIKDANTEGTGLNEWINQHLEAVTNGLLIGGMLAVVLGLILAFYGNIPIGLALIGLGLAAMYEAAELNGGLEALINEHLDQVTTALVIVGAVAVALGIIMIIAGNVPLGVALLVLGLGSLIGAAVLNWDAIKEFFTNLWESIKNVSQQVWTAVKDFFGGVWRGICDVAKTVWNGLKTFFINLWDGIKNVASSVWNAIKTFFVNLWNGLRTIATNVWNAIKTAVVNIVTGISERIRTAFTNVKTFVSTTFDTIKTKIMNVWNGISTGIKSVVNTIIGVIEGMVNGVISGINFMVRAVNKLSFDVPDWVPALGGKKFGFNLTEVQKISIPRLAEGAVIPANKEFLAVLGDQKTGTNIETPLATMVEAFRTAMETYGGGDVTIPIYLDGKQIARHVININQQRQFASNY